MVKNSELDSLRIHAKNNFHFIYPMKTSQNLTVDGFFSAKTASNSKLGLWLIIIPQIINKILGII